VSKFSLDVLEKRVFPFVGSSDPDVLLKATFGEDVALTKVGGDILASHVDPIVGAVGNIGWLAVHVACNDIASSGIRPRWVQLLVLVPGEEETELLEQIMRDASRAAEDLGVAIVGGHTGYSSGISRPVVAVTSLGVAAGRVPLHTRGASEGDWILATKGVAQEGTSILAQDFQDVALELGLSEVDLSEARELATEVSVVEEALLLADHGASSMHDVTRGGLLETLLEMGSLSGLSLHVEESLVPRRPVVSRFAEAFRFDPLRMISSGSLAATVSPDRLPEARHSLEEAEIPYAVVGRVEQGAGVNLFVDGERIHYEGVRCEDDELARLWKQYPREE
jgi:hydrogenase expression/formation protein HypE